MVDSEVDVVAASDTKEVGVSATITQTVMALNPDQVDLVLLPLENFLGQGLEVVEVIVETSSVRVQLVGMMIGIPNAHDTRYCSHLVVPSSRRFIAPAEFLFDTVKPSDGSIITVEVSIRLVFIVSFAA